MAGIGLGDISGGEGGLSSSSSASTGGGVGIGGFSVGEYTRGIKTEYVLAGLALVSVVGLAYFTRGRKSKRKG